MGEDKFIEELDSIYVNSKEHRGKVSKFKKEYRGGLKFVAHLKLPGNEDYGIVDAINCDTKDFYDEKKIHESKGCYSALANRGFIYAKKNKDFGIAFKSAMLYEKIGQGNRTSVKRRLLNALKNQENISKGDVDRVRKFLKRNPIEKSNLGTKVLTSIFGIVTAVGILFGINSMTGAAIGFNSVPSGFLGAVLFVGGIAGLFFSMRKKK